MNNDPKPAQDATLIFRLALGFLALAFAAFIASDFAGDENLRISLTTAGITTFTAGIVFGLWGAWKLLRDWPSITFHKRLMRALGIQPVFPLRRLLLHLALTTLVALAMHFYFLHEARAEAALVAANLKQIPWFERTLPSALMLDEVEYFELRPAGNPVRLSLVFGAKRPVMKYVHVMQNRLRELRHVDALESGYSDAVVQKLLSPSFRKDITWRELNQDSLAEFESILIAFPYIQFDNAAVRNISPGNYAYMSEVNFRVTSFDVQSSHAYRFFDAGGTLFVRAGARLWVFMPTSAIHTVDRDTFARPSAVTTGFLDEIPLRPFLSHAWNFLLPLIPFLYLRRTQALPRFHRITLTLLLFITAAFLLLTFMDHPFSFEYSTLCARYWSLPSDHYGWPWRAILQEQLGGRTQVSTKLLAANLAVLLTLLALTAFVAERVLRRKPPTPNQEPAP